MKMHESLILASKSASRRQMLENAGLNFTCVPAEIDERAVEKKLQASPKKLTAELARLKALAVADKHKDALVIGSDSTVEFDGQSLSKAQNKEEAVQKLMRLSGKTHYLVSSVAVAKGRLILWETTQSARLKMRSFDEAFARRYIEKIGDAAMDCVGAYQLEALGPWLFEEIEGDYFTILGMPLINLIGYLQDYHGLDL
ncbi:MAG: Maf family protein [Alphaproteobacteria bacterium]